MTCFNEEHWARPLGFDPKCSKCVQEIRDTINEFKKSATYKSTKDLEHLLDIVERMKPQPLTLGQYAKIQEKISKLNAKRSEKSDTLAVNHLNCDGIDEEKLSAEQKEQHQDDYWAAVDEIEATDPEIITWNKIVQILEDFVKEKAKDFTNQLEQVI